MTSPDGVTPDGALSGTGLAAYANTTQAQWQSQITSGTTSHFTGAQDGFTSILLLLERIPLIGSIIEVLTGLEDGDLNDLGTIVNNFLRTILTGVPVGAITNVQPELLAAPIFGTGSIGSDSRWTIDTNSSRSSDGSGAVKVIANGVPTALRSGSGTSSRIIVGAGQRITTTIYVKHQGYSGSGVGAPVRLQIAPYVGSVLGDFVTLDSYTPTGATLDWPGHALSGTYTVPDGVTGIQLRLYVAEIATAGTFWFDDASVKQVATLPKSWIEGLADEFNGVAARIQAFIDAVVHALTGSTSIINSLEDVISALLAIPFGNVLGVGGPGNIGQSVVDFINNLVGGLVGAVGEGAGLADVFNISNLVSSWASLGNSAWEILGLRNNTPIYTGLLPNGKSNYPVTGINTTLSCTQSASLISTYRINESSPLGVVSWLGYGTSGITEFYINVWKINETTGNWGLVQHSPNIVGNLEPGATPQWNFWELANPIPVVAGEQYAFELVSVGGTHSVRGIDTTDTIPDHPYANVVGMAATRDNTTNPNSPPATIAKASVTRAAKVAWIEVAIDTGTGAGHHDPITVYFTESGSIPIPAWAEYVEVVALGAGGGGKSGGTAGFYGEGGGAGKFATAVWERGVDFTDSTTNVVITVGGGGAGGVLFSNGAGGGGTTVKVDATALTAGGGSGGDAFGINGIGANFVGNGPGEYTFNDQLYLGGVVQNVYGSGGQSPGGGGSGGNWITVSSGGAGASGAAWIRFRQGVIDGGDVVDNTPPTPPTVTLDSATYSTITITASGSTD